MGYLYKLYITWFLQLSKKGNRTRSKVNTCNFLWLLCNTGSNRYIVSIACVFSNILLNRGDHFFLNMFYIQYAPNLSWSNGTIGLSSFNSISCCSVKNCQGLKLNNATKLRTVQRYKMFREDLFCRIMWIYGIIYSKFK